MDSLHRMTGPSFDKQQREEETKNSLKVKISSIPKEGRPLLGRINSDQIKFGVGEKIQYFFSTLFHKGDLSLDEVLNEFRKGNRALLKGYLVNHTVSEQQLSKVLGVAEEVGDLKILTRLSSLMPGVIPKQSLFTLFEKSYKGELSKEEEELLYHYAESSPDLFSSYLGEMLDRLSVSQNKGTLLVSLLKIGISDSLILRFFRGHPEYIGILHKVQNREMFDKAAQEILLTLDQSFRNPKALEQFLKLLDKPDMRFLDIALKQAIPNSMASAAVLLKYGATLKSETIQQYPDHVEALLDSSKENLSLQAIEDILRTLYESCSEQNQAVLGNIMGSLIKQLPRGAQLKSYYSAKLERMVSPLEFMTKISVERGALLREVLSQEYEDLAKRIDEGRDSESLGILLRGMNEEEFLGALQQCLSEYDTLGIKQNSKDENGKSRNQIDLKNRKDQLKAFLKQIRSEAVFRKIDVSQIDRRLNQSS